MQMEEAFDDEMGLFADDFDLLEKECCDYMELEQEEKIQKLFEDAELAWVDENGVIHFYPTTTLGKYYTEFCLNDNKVVEMTDDQITEIVQQYTNHESKYYRKLNLFLAADNKEISSYALYTNKLNFGIRHLAGYYPVTVPRCYRGIHCSEIEMGHYIENSFIYIPSFLSASQNLEHVYSETQNTIFVIVLKEIPNNAFTVTQKYSPFAETEEEALFSAYSKFKIIAKIKNKVFNGKLYEYYLELEHINEGKKLELKVPLEKESKDYSIGLVKRQFPPLYKLSQFQYIHVLDRTTNLTRIEFGPQNYIEQPDELVSNDIQNMICLPLKTYCSIKNPVKLVGNDKHQFENQFGISKYKIANDLNNCEPFPLYPNEEIEGNIKNLMAIEAGQILKVQSIDNYKERKIGEQWFIKGPQIYLPNEHEKAITIINTMIIQPLQALKVKALQDMIDCNGVQRTSGELWLIRNKSQYLPLINEQLLTLVDAHILTEKTALHLKATNDFMDIYGITRKTGEEWLVTAEISPFHIVDVNEEIVKEVELTIVKREEFCTILDPFDCKTRRNVIGKKIIKIGPCAFFLQPGEELTFGNVYILQENQALIFRAQMPVEIALSNKTIKKLKAGENCMIRGPQLFIPPIEGNVSFERELILLSKTEGIYVRNNTTGQIKSIRGHAYMLSENEQLYENSKIPLTLEQVFPKNRRNYDIITNYCPFNHAVQIYDFKTKENHVLLGPCYTYLEPWQQFTVNSVSGGLPKQPNFETFINICLGPTFTTDIVTVETSDHALLDIKLCYQVKFQIDSKSTPEEKNKIFKVKDYIGDLCNLMASIIRSATSKISFEEFHKTGALHLYKAIFGEQNQRVLPLNNLVIQNVDIQSIEPIDKRISTNLEKNVVLAISITTQRQEASARHEAEKLDQDAKSLLEQQILKDKQEIEITKLNLLELQAESKRILTKGNQVSTILAQQEKKKIEMQTKLKTIELQMKSKVIRFTNCMNSSANKTSIEFKHELTKNQLELEKIKQLAEIESKKIETMTKILGKEVLQAIQKMEPSTKQKLVQSLGLKQNALFSNQENFFCLSS